MLRFAIIFLFVVSAARAQDLVPLSPNLVHDWNYQFYWGMKSADAQLCIGKRFPPISSKRKISTRTYSENTEIHLFDIIAPETFGSRKMNFIFFFRNDSLFMINVVLYDVLSTRTEPKPTSQEDTTFYAELDRFILSNWDSDIPIPSGWRIKTSHEGYYTLHEEVDEDGHWGNAWHMHKEISMGDPIIPILHVKPKNWRRARK